ncbi:MAG TPA: hypothetical protein VK152_11415 [Paludibacter sp.]|nr:hypothetical protein [Paludibacter sp.]
MRKDLDKNIFKIAYWLFSIALIIEVIIRKNVQNEILSESINYFFWYTFGFATAVFLLSRFLGNIHNN